MNLPCAASSWVCCFGKEFDSEFNTALKLPCVASSWVLNPSHTIKEPPVGEPLKVQRTGVKVSGWKSLAYSVWDCRSRGQKTVSTYRILRYSEGLCPKCCLKTLEKYRGSSKPTARAISLIEPFRDSKNRTASLIRYSVRYCWGEIKTCCINT